MRKGEVIRGYTVLHDPSTVDGGQCRWAFVQRGSRQYFMKQFLAPKYPVPGSPGSETTKRKKLAECKRFEKHHRELMNALSAVASKSGEGGNLVVAIDWFLHRTTYYKVTEKIDVTSLTLAEIASRPLPEKLLLLITVTHSVQILHRNNIVHGDLKPGNILVKTTESGTLTTKLIDFDNAFFSGEPPENQEELVGTMSHYSPEVYEFIKGSRAPSEITTASDIFSLGLIFSQFLSGRLPPLPSEMKHACVAAAGGAVLTPPKEVTSAGLRALIEGMLSKDPEARPKVGEVFSELKRVRDGGRHSLGLARRSHAKGEDSAPTVRGLEKFAKHPSGREKERAEPPAGEGVVIRGLEKFRKRDS